MLKIVTILLLAFQTLGLARPVMCSPGAHEASTCEHATPLRDAAAVDASDPCDACGMPDCHDMATCAATTSAALAATVSVPAAPDAQGAHRSFAGTLDSYTRTPVRPPPRA